MTLSREGCHVHKSICLPRWQEPDKKIRTHQYYYFTGLEGEGEGEIKTLGEAWGRVGGSRAHEALIASDKIQERPRGLRNKAEMLRCYLLSKNKRSQRPLYGKGCSTLRREGKDRQEERNGGSLNPIICFAATPVYNTEWLEK